MFIPDNEKCHFCHFSSSPNLPQISSLFFLFVLWYVVTNPELSLIVFQCFTQSQRSTKFYISLVVRWSYVQHKQVQCGPRIWYTWWKSTWTKYIRNVMFASKASRTFSPLQQQRLRPWLLCKPYFLIAYLSLQAHRLHLYLRKEDCMIHVCRTASYCAMQFKKTTVVRWCAEGYWSIESQVHCRSDYSIILASFW